MFEYFDQILLTATFKWLTTVFRRLKSAQTDFLPVVNIARVDKNCASNSKEAQTSFSTENGIKPT